MSTSLRPSQSTRSSLCTIPGVGTPQDRQASDNLATIIPGSRTTDTMDDLDILQLEGLVASHDAQAEALQANFAFDDSDEEQDDFDEEDGQDDEYADGQAESQISTQADQHATSTLKHYRPGRDSRKHD
ncbi:hypothetical protein [Sporisorium scitamineum]|uniref:Uncharacterized protein n=1 Tax=Sporisorium scitamineum TaxID=49012 RepID=A0A0F7S5U7_9BASI|nr:hypothetical protein [Sporisorium scitamineum]